MENTWAFKQRFGENYNYRYKNMSKYSAYKENIMHDEFKRTDKSWDVTMGREKLQAIPAGTPHNGFKSFLK